MKKFTEAYAPELEEYGLGDFYLPDNCSKTTPAVLLIHGGGWCALDKSSCTGIAEFLCEQGYLVYSINYRLCGTVPWPACAIDCLKAAEFMLAGAGLPEGTADFSQLIVCGGSAGGHLALYCGLKMGFPKVKSIIAISPIADPLPDYEIHKERYDNLFGCGTTEKLLDNIAPLQFVEGRIPDIFISHAHIDTAVPQESSRNFTAQLKERNYTSIEEFFYEGIGTGHKIWIPDSSPHRLLVEIENAIKNFLDRTR